MMLDPEEIAGALARGYCHQNNWHKILDEKLIWAMHKEVMMLIEKEEHERNRGSVFRRGK